MSRIENPTSAMLRIARSATNYHDEVLAPAGERAGIITELFGGPVSPEVKAMAQEHLAGPTEELLSRFFPLGVNPAQQEYFKRLVGIIVQVDLGVSGKSKFGIINQRWDRYNERIVESAQKGVILPELSFAAIANISDQQRVGFLNVFEALTEMTIGEPDEKKARAAIKALEAVLAPDANYGNQFRGEERNSQNGKYSLDRYYDNVRGRSVIKEIQTKPIELITGLLARNNIRMSEESVLNWLLLSLAHQGRIYCELRGLFDKSAQDSVATGTPLLDRTRNRVAQLGPAVEAAAKALREQQQRKNASMSALEALADTPDNVRAIEPQSEKLNDSGKEVLKRQAEYHGIIEAYATAIRMQVATSREVVDGADEHLRSLAIMQMGVLERLLCSFEVISGVLRTITGFYARCAQLVSRAEMIQAGQEFAKQIKDIPQTVVADIEAKYQIRLTPSLFPGLISESETVPKIPAKTE